MLDHIYQKIIKQPAITQYILVTGDGHFHSVIQLVNRGSVIIVPQGKALAAFLLSLVGGHLTDQLTSERNNEIL